MDPGRFVLSDTVWEKIEALLPGREGHVGVTAKDNRLFLEAVLWRARAGPASRVRPLEQRVHALPPLGAGDGF